MPRVNAQPNSVMSLAQPEQERRPPFSRTLDTQDTAMKKMLSQFLSAGILVAFMALGSQTVSAATQVQGASRSHDTAIKTQQKRKAKKAKHAKKSRKSKAHSPHTASKNSGAIPGS